MAPASPKQTAFIRSLLDEREGDHVEDIRNELNGGPVTKQVASWAIEQLLAIPKTFQGPKVDVDAIEPGYYVRTEDDGEAGTQVVYVVVLNKAKTHKYAKRLEFDPMNSRASWQYVKGGIYRLDGLAPLTVEEAAKLGHLHGVCVVCAAQLTDPKSVERGIGPVCAKKLA